MSIVTENITLKTMGVDEVLKLAENQDLSAIYELACRCQYGTGGAEKNIHKSIQLYKKILEHERNVDVLYRLGYIYASGDMGKENRVQALQYYEAAVALGDSEAAIQLGLIYEIGDIVKVDYDRALRLYMTAIKYGKEDTCFYAGEICRYKDMTKQAVYYYNIAFKNGCLSAAFPLGWYYKDDTEVEKNIVEMGKDESISYLAKLCYQKAFTEKGKFSEYLNKAIVFGKEAVTLNKYSVEAFDILLHALLMKGSILHKMDVFDEAKEIFDDAFSYLEWINGNNLKNENITKLECDLRMEGGELAWKMKDTRRAKQLLSGLDVDKYLFARIICLLLDEGLSENDFF